MSIALPSAGLWKSLIPCCVQHSRRRAFLRSQPYLTHYGRAVATAASPDIVPYRKQLKDEAKRRRLVGNTEYGASGKAKEDKAKKWELTVGIEVHAQLNTERKLFSSKLWRPLRFSWETWLTELQGARTSVDAEPNTHVALFDLAYPGTQPVKSFLVWLRNWYLSLRRNSRRQPWYRHCGLQSLWSAIYKDGADLIGNTTFTLISRPGIRSRNTMVQRLISTGETSTDVWGRTTCEGWKLDPVRSRWHCTGRRRIGHDWYQADTNGARHCKDDSAAPFHHIAGFQPCLSSFDWDHYSSAYPSSPNRSSMREENTSHIGGGQRGFHRNGDGRLAGWCQCLCTIEGSGRRSFEYAFLLRRIRNGSANRDQEPEQL